MKDLIKSDWVNKSKVSLSSEQEKLLEDFLNRFKDKAVWQVDGFVEDLCKKTIEIERELSKYRVYKFKE